MTKKHPPKNSPTWLSLWQRFHSGLRKGDDGCWVCENAKRKSGGYRVLVANRKPFGIYRIFAHRLSYLIFNGPIPDGLFVCHRCDNRECCNPEHLFLGTAADNARDMALKARSRAGESHANAKLTEEQVGEIIRLYSSGVKQSEIANQFGVTQAAISLATTGKTWARSRGQLAKPAAKRQRKSCKVDGCKSTARRNGMCGLHHGRWSRTGTTEPKPVAVQDLQKLLVEKFVSGVVPLPSGCWECSTAGYTHDRGYGRIGVGRSQQGSIRKFVHRVSYEHFHGPIPSDMVVCHSCDNRRCCNPHHLFLGSQSENLADMVRKGRSRFGERHHNAVLSSEDVAKIRSMAGQLPQSRIAAKFGIKQPTVSGIIRRKKWSHLR